MINKIDLLKNKLLEIEELKANYNEAVLKQWKAETAMIIENIIGNDSSYFMQFSNISYEPMVWTKGNLDRISKERYMEGLDEAKSVLKAIIFGIENELI